MKGIERSERFEGERAAGAAQYLVVEGEAGHDHTLAPRDDAPDLFSVRLGEEPGEDRARISVDVQRSARTSSRRRRRTPGARSRLRRGRYARASFLRRVIEPRRTSSAKAS